MCQTYQSVFSTIMEKCTATCKNGKQCSYKARKMLDNKPVCLKHYKVLGECCICMENMESGSLLLDCGHMFHKHCLVTWTQHSETCPLCRMQMTPHNLVQINKQYVGLLAYMIFSIDPRHRLGMLTQIDDIITGSYLGAMQQ